MLFSDARKRKIVSTGSAETVGKVAGFLVDPAERSVVAITVKKADAGEFVRWSDITGFGADAVTVASATLITDGDDVTAALAGKEHEVLGKRVLSTRGDDLGKVKDVEFDPVSGAVTAFVVDKTRIEADGLRGIGSYAVVLALP